MRVRRSERLMCSSMSASYHKEPSNTHMLCYTALARRDRSGQPRPTGPAANRRGGRPAGTIEGGLKRGVNFPKAPTAERWAEVELASWFSLINEAGFWLSTRSGGEEVYSDGTCSVVLPKDRADPDYVKKVEGLAEDLAEICDTSPADILRNLEARAATARGELVPCRRCGSLPELCDLSNGFEGVECRHCETVISALSKLRNETIEDWNEYNA